MAEFQTRGSPRGSDWMFRQSRPAGLYGELPPMPTGIPADRPYPALTRKPRRAPSTD